MNQRNAKGSVSAMSGSTEGEAQYSEEDTKPQGKAKGKKAPAGGKAAQNGKRKQEDNASKQAAKRQRANSEMEEDDEDMDEEMDTLPDGRKMTDEEKRKNFLERNR